METLAVRFQAFGFFWMFVVTIPQYKWLKVVSLVVTEDVTGTLP